MKLVALLFAAICFAVSTPSDSATASIYDSNVVQDLQLSGTQKHAMQKVIAASRARRSRIFKKYGIDPKAKPNIVAAAARRVGTEV
jgi:hypothetical protein